MAERDDDLLSRGRRAFQLCRDAEDHNRTTAIDDLKFARLGEQWPEQIVKQREREGRPCLTINRLPSFVRQVVNDARQNKPSIKVRPADSVADPKVADIMNGLIRNIEYTSGADIAYDTAVENAVTCGFGYIRIGIDYAFDDAFDMDINIRRVLNPFSVYGDPRSTSADGSDWNVAFVVERMSKDEFKAKYKGKAVTDFDNDAWTSINDDVWLTEDGVLIGEWWTREEVDKTIYLLSDGTVVDDEFLASEETQTAIEVGAIQIVNQRVTKTHKVTQRIMSGADILEENEWPGRYIPIVPVYGEEIDIEGKRYFRSLIHNAKDAQSMFNFWRTASTELVALAPRVPYIGPEGAFDVDEDKWRTINTVSHPYVEYSKTAPAPPQRQPLDTGVAAGALQEALNASDDMKAIMGLYDASLGARSNETSGRAIMARQREGDISTFHFIDNMARAIRHAGRIIIDLIPRVYNQARIVRVLGEDGTETPEKVNQPTPETDDDGNPVTDEQGNPMMRVYDLTAGKYDLTVTTGPSFTTRREEAAAQMTELVRAFPQAAPFIADIMARNFDWPGADEIAKRFEKMNPAAQQELPPQVQQAIQEGQQQIAQLSQENESLKNDQSMKQAQFQQEMEFERYKEDRRFDLEIEKIANQRRIAAMKNDGTTRQGEGGQEEYVSGTEMLMEGLTMLGQLVAQTGQATNAQLDQIAAVMAAPKRIIKDEAGRPAGVETVV